MHIYTLQTKFGGKWNHSVRPSICLSIHLFTSCLGHKILSPYLIWIIFHTNFVHDTGMCHDLDLRLYLEGQGHNAHMPKIRVPAISPHCHVGFGQYFTQLLSMILVCHDLDPRSYLQGRSAHMPKIRVRP